MSHTLTTNTGLCDLNTTAITYNALITDLFVFTAVTLPVFAWSEDSLTEKSVLLRLQSPVIDGLRLCYLTSGPLQDFLR